MSADLILLAPDPTPDREFMNPYHDPDTGRFTDKDGIGGRGVTIAKGGAIARKGDKYQGPMGYPTTSGNAAHNASGKFAPKGHGKTWSAGGKSGNIGPRKEGPKSMLNAAIADKKAADKFIGTDPSRQFLRQAEPYLVSRLVSAPPHQQRLAAYLGSPADQFKDPAERRYGVSRAVQIALGIPRPKGFSAPYGVKKDRVGNLEAVLNLIAKRGKQKFPAPTELREWLIELAADAADDLTAAELATIMADLERQVGMQPGATPNDAQVTALLTLLSA